MRGLPGTTAISLVLASIHNVQAQRPNLDESAFDEARFPISRGDNFTFQPAVGSLCQWAVVQYPLSGKEFFVLDSQLACAPLAGNASTTLRLRFGDEIAPGNATLTVQCKEPSVWNFIINDDEPEQEGKTVLDSVCDSGDTSSVKDGFDGDRRNGSSAGSHRGSTGTGGPFGGPILPGHRGNWSHDMPTSFSTTSSRFLTGFSQDSNSASNLASNPSNTLIGGDPSGTAIDAGAPGSRLPTSLVLGRPGSPTSDAAGPSTTGASNPASGSENDLPSVQLPQESLSAVPPTADPLRTEEPTMNNSDGATNGNTNASATNQPLRSIMEPMTSMPSDGLQVSATSALPSSCVCTC